MASSEKFETGLRMILEAVDEAAREGRAPFSAGAMLSFRVGDGTLETTRAFIRRCFDAGLVLYYGGHEPACGSLCRPRS